MADDWISVTRRMVEDARATRRERWRTAECEACPTGKIIAGGAETRFRFKVRETRA